ncbi:MAG: deoxyribose-phosphate aldolase [Bacillota bacterium]|nr:deoxyribose-phosphate aldolase [Bacillota bacterium]
MMDHTILKADATENQIIKLCDEAVKYGFASVCINPVFVKIAANYLRGTGIKVCTVIGFPLGAAVSRVKGFEAEDAVGNGASEVDMVIGIGSLKSGNYIAVEKDIKEVVDAVKGNALVKVILETCYLTDEEKVKGCIIAKQAGAHFVKTSTGFGSGGATVEDVALFRNTVGKEMGVKAAGGIRDLDTALKMINAGATRLGTSASISIVESVENSGNTAY